MLVGGDKAVKIERSNHIMNKKGEYTKIGVNIHEL